MYAAGRVVNKTLLLFLTTKHKDRVGAPPGDATCPA
jgi:hypothetical protein